MNKWSKKIIIDKIKSLKDKTGQHVREEDYAFYQSTKKYFGSWRSAVEASGFNYDDIKYDILLGRHKKKKEAIIKEIKKLLSLKKYKIRPPLITAGIVYFGSWKNAVEASGFNYDNIKIQKWTKETIIKKLQQMNNLSIINISRDTKLYSAIRKHFGSLDIALKALGSSKKNIQEERKQIKKKWVVNEIKKLDNKHKTDAWVSKYCPLLYGRAIRLFKCWSAAIKESGFNYNKIRVQKTWTSEKVIREIKKLKYKNASWVNKNNSSLFHAGLLYFSSWGGAVTAAGFDYNKIKKSYKNETKLRSILFKLFGRNSVHEQKSFVWLKYKNRLRLDFYIPKIKTAIEYNGRQHYEAVDWSGRGNRYAQRDLKIVKARDRRKNKLLRDYGILCISIPYTEPITIDNIKNILSKHRINNYMR